MTNPKGKSPLRFRRSYQGALAVIVAWGALMLASPSRGQLTTVQNDTVVDFSQAGIQVGFVAGESAAAWLTSPCDGTINTVQILWLSLTGGAPDSLQQAVTVFENGVFPNPGPVLVELGGPVLSDGFFNEFPVGAPIPVTVGETFVVALTFFTDPPPVGPSVANDVDGCQAGRNGIFAIPPSAWFSSCLLGVSGDFAIRAVVECTDNDEIFSDGFESGDTLMWDSSVPPPSP